MIFGWNRLPPKLHFFATCMVVVGSSLSVFWIMVVNSWMQTPAGVVLQDGRLILTSYREAIFNPDMVFAVSHMYVACLETSLFVIGGISAWYVLRRRHVEFFTRSFQVALIAALVIAPLQALIGDETGRHVAKHQPIKLAAMEAHWDTNPPGEGAAWIIAAWPDEANQKNVWAVEVPYVLSLLLTHSPTGEVKGLKEFPKDVHPPVLITFYTFRVMVIAGFALRGPCALDTVAVEEGSPHGRKAPRGEVASLGLDGGGTPCLGSRGRGLGHPRGGPPALAGLQPCENKRVGHGAPGGRGCGIACGLPRDCRPARGGISCPGGTGAGSRARCRDDGAAADEDGSGLRGGCPWKPCRPICPMCFS